MKSQRMNSVFGLALLVTISLVGAVLLVPAGDALAGKASRKLEGTWLVQVTIQNCQTGDDLKTFPALLTFAQGGTLTETTTGFTPAARTPGHGFWRFADGAYSASSEAFLFGPDGTYIGRQTIGQAIEFGSDPDAFSSTASITIVDPGGNTVMTGCATAVASRMK
ncbi:MAG: hypothetical protein IPF82_06830 [Blastocatellia bacterium]|nr:hypothetical protein [Blastocatellia bacterium]